MSHAFRATVMIAAAAGALLGMAGERLYAQGADPNAAPNPYKMQENWAQLAEGRKFGAAIKVQIDHSDGKSIWVFDRCGATECTNSTLAPMEKFDSSGKFQKATARACSRFRTVSMWTARAMCGAATRSPGMARAPISSSLLPTEGC